MSTLNLVRSNTLANLLGYSCAALLQLILAPFFMRFLGIEGYALIGFYLMLIASVQIFDFGLSQTLGRELARLSTDSVHFGGARDLLRTLETIFWPIVVAVVALLLSGVPLIAEHVLNSGRLAPEVVESSLWHMILLAALQWPATFYFSGLMGLQRQILANALKVVISTVSGVGALVAVSSASEPLIAYFRWQVLCSLVALACYWVALSRSLPKPVQKTRFRPEIVRSTWRFATGIATITLSTLLLTQADKWIVAQALPLASFGYFMLSVSVSTALALLVMPVFNAVLPRFSGLVALGENEALFDLYHTATQAIAAVLLPAALVLCLFSGEILLLWMGDADVARNAAPLLSIMVIGTALNGLFHVPYAWALARGRTRFISLINLAAIFVLMPFLWLLTPTHGAMVAAVGWVILNLSYLLIFVPVVHRELPPRHRLQWLLRDIGLPLALSLTITGLGRLVMPPDFSKAVVSGSLGVLLSLAIFSAVSVSPGLRRLVREILIRPHAGERSRT